MHGILPILLQNLNRPASAIETQNNAVLALRKFDNITRPLKNILMLTLRHSDVELQRLRKKLIKNIHHHRFL